MKRLTPISWMLITGMIAALLIAFVSCASLPVKERAVRTLSTAESLLGQVQDTERRLCNAPAYAAAPQAPITECVGPLAEGLLLTTTRHQRIATALSRAFDAQIKASVVLRAWRAGDPVPASLPDMFAAVIDVAGVVKELSPNSDITKIIETLIQVRSDLEALDAALKGAQ